MFKLTVNVVSVRLKKKKKKLKGLTTCFDVKPDPCKLANKFQITMGK